MYIISGVYIESGFSVEPRYDPEVGENRAALISQDGCYSFIGLIISNGLELVGEMLDPLGVADLTRVVLGENSLTYCKKYRRAHNIPIKYKFDRQEDGTWMGGWTMTSEYDGDICGAARCLIEEVSDNFIQEALVQHSLSRSLG